MCLFAHDFLIRGVKKKRKPWHDLHYTMKIWMQKPNHGISLINASVIGKSENETSGCAPRVSLCPSEYKCFSRGHFFLFLLIIWRYIMSKTILQFWKGYIIFYAKKYPASMFKFRSNIDSDYSENESDFAGCSLHQHWVPFSQHGACLQYTPGDRSEWLSNFAARSLLIMHSSCTF